jgi:IS5 family transposase
MDTKRLSAEIGYMGHKERKREMRKEEKIYLITDKANCKKKFSLKQKKRNKKISSVRSFMQHPFGVTKKHLES